MDIRNVPDVSSGEGLPRILVNPPELSEKGKDVLLADDVPNVFSGDPPFGDLSS